LYAGTIPFHFSATHESIRARLHALPLDPLISPDTGHRLSIPDVVQNILLFLPFGALGVLAGSTRRVWARVLWVTVLGAALSCLVESLQLLTSDRVASVGDVVFNTAGTAIGAVLAWQLRAAFAAGLRRLQQEGLADVAELRPFAMALLVILIAFWQPFDVTLEVGTVAAKVHALRADAWQFSGLRDEGMSIMLSAFLAMTLASYLSVLGEARAGRKAAAIGVVLVSMLEASQILIGSRMPGLWDAVVASFGVALGAGLWAAASTIIWPRLWLGVFVAMTVVAAALQMLSPFEIADRFHTMGWFPFLGYYRHTTFETLSHVIEIGLLYFPLGYWAGAAGAAGLPTEAASEASVRRRLAYAGGVGLALVIAGPIELGQGWIVGRYPDITDVALSLAGASLGVWAGLRKSRDSGGQ
jgi:VanZ family protein